MPLYTDGSPHDHIELLSHRCVSRPSFCCQTLLGLTVLQEVFHRHRRSTTVAHNTTLLPRVNTFGRGMFCGAKYTHHTFSPIIKESKADGEICKAILSPTTGLQETITLDRSSRLSTEDSSILRPRCPTAVSDDICCLRSTTASKLSILFTLFLRCFI